METLDTFESDLVEFLSHLSPTQPNLFKPGVLSWDSGNDSGSLSLDCKYRIQSAEFELPSMTWKEDKALGKYLLESVDFQNVVTLEWREDAYRTMQKYHFDWFNKWYNRQENTLVTGVDGKFRTLPLTLYHYTSNNSSNPIFTTPAATEIATITLKGLRPKTFGKFKLSQAEDNVGEILSCSYIVKNIIIDYASATNNTTKADAMIETIKQVLGVATDAEAKPLQRTIFFKEEAYEGYLA